MGCEKIEGVNKMLRKTAISLMIALFQILFSSTAWASEFDVSFDEEKKHNNRFSG